MAEAPSNEVHHDFASSHVPPFPFHTQSGIDYHLPLPLLPASLGSLSLYSPVELFVRHPFPQAACDERLSLINLSNDQQTVAQAKNTPFLPFS